MNLVSRPSTSAAVIIVSVNDSVIGDASLLKNI